MGGLVGGTAVTPEYYTVAIACDADDPEADEDRTCTSGKIADLVAGKTSPINFFDYFPCSHLTESVREGMCLRRVKKYTLLAVRGDDFRFTVLLAAYNPHLAAALAEARVKTIAVIQPLIAVGGLDGADLRFGECAHEYATGYISGGNKGNYSGTR